MTFMEILPMIVYILLIVFLVVLIIIGIKLIGVVDKTDKLLINVQDKINSFNSLFRVIDLASDKITSGVNSIVEFFISLVNKIFRKRKDEE